MRSSKRFSIATNSVDNEDEVGDAVAGGVTTEGTDGGGEVGVAAGADSPEDLARTLHDEPDRVPIGDGREITYLALAAALRLAWLFF